jgi:hypothetical protein
MDADRLGASKLLFLLIEEVGETLLRNKVQQAIDLLSILHPAANAVLHGGWHVDHPATVVQADGQIKGRMLLTMLAMAAGLAARPPHRDETATEQRVLGDMLDCAGARMSLFGRALRAGFHGFHGGSSLIYKIISDSPRKTSGKTNANLPQVSFRHSKARPRITYGREHCKLAELLPALAGFAA